MAPQSEVLLFSVWKGGSRRDGSLSSPEGLWFLFRDPASTTAKALSRSESSAFKLRMNTIFDFATSIFLPTLWPSTILQRRVHDVLNMMTSHSYDIFTLLHVFIY